MKMFRLYSVPFFLSLFCGSNFANAQVSTIEGMYTLIHGDKLRGKAVYEHEIKDDQGQRHHLYGSRIQPHSLSTGVRIRVTGKPRKLSLPRGDASVASGLQPHALDVSKVEILEVPRGNDQVSQSSEPIVKKVLAILVRLQDAAPVCSVSQVQDVVFNKLAPLYNEMSNGKIIIEGKVVGPITIPLKKAQGCNTSLWSAATEMVLDQQGYTDAGTYTNWMMVMPNIGCGAGWGTFGGWPAQSWIMLCNTPDVYGHEFGHNILAHHAGNFGGSEYGDRSDIMGYSGVGLRHFNLPHQVQMGWTTAAEITQSGIYTIKHLRSTEGMKGLRLRRPMSRDMMYLSYRVPGGKDVAVASAYAHKLNLHMYPGTGTVFTRFVRALDVGQIWNDTYNKITITVQSKTADSMTVKVTMPTQ